MAPRTPSLFPDDAPTAGAKPSGTLTAHCDGGARGNPGPAGYGVEIADASGNVVAELSEFLGFRTNNFAEYSGLLAALQYALDHGHRSLRVVSDSLLMVKQIQGVYKVKSPDLLPLWQEARRRIAGLDRFEITHALRHKNKAADRLANEAMDRGMRRGTPAEGESVVTRPGSSGADSRSRVTSLPLRAIPYPTASAEAPPPPPGRLDPAPPRTAGERAPHAPILLTPNPPREPGRDRTAERRTDSKPPMLRGFTRDGAVHLLGSETLPDGIFVKVIPE